jgi:alpha-glucosidase
VRFRDGATTVDVTALTDDIFRVGVFADGMPVEYRSEAVVFDRAPSGDLGRVRVERGRIAFEAYGRVFAADADGVLPFSKVRAEGERYFGCGERTAGLEKTGSHQVFWNVDPPEGHTASLNNLYTSIPLVLSLVDGRAHGVFLDHPGRVEFDLAKADPARFTAVASNPLVYYAFAGPMPRDVLAQYTELTGRISLPPLWALGNQQSKWGYKDADEVRAIARGYRERGIPCDVVYLDIDHMDGYRVFTFDGARFPDPAGFVAELEADGFKVVCITDPGVKVDEDYGVYVSGRERDLYCKTKRGTEYRNVVWPGLCAFPDFTNPEAREWWGDQQAPLVDAGVAGVWCDMDEPALFVPDQSTMPDDVVHPGGGDARYHKDVHNLYGSLMARAAREGLERLRPDRRPFVITRAGYAGLQREALQWTGDNSSWWEHLWMSMPQLQNLGLSGVSFCGVDIGGFFGDCNGELLARWTEFGIFQPFCRNHSVKGAVPQEPWAFGEPWETVCRDMLALRMRLLPYLYGLFDEAARTGAPILRPLLFEYPDDPVTYSADDEFLVGDALLMAPITRPGIEHRHVYLPSGTWFHWWTGERIDGPAHVLAHAPLGRPALYARANAAIPLWPVLQHTGERPDELTLRVFPGGEPVTRTLYEDAGEGYGPWARRTVTCDGRTLALGPCEGDFTPSRVRVEAVGGGTIDVVTLS